MTPNPHEILLDMMEREPPAFRKWAAEADDPSINLPPIVPISALVRPDPANDADELIRHRYLCRGGMVLFVGPTGVGKSSFVMQAALQWALGRPHFGLQPAIPLRVLIIQAENDEGDMAEMRDGVLKALALPPGDVALLADRVRVVTEDTRTGPRFAAMLDALLEQWPADLVIMDPAFAYLGADASAQKEVTPFLRNMLLPVVHRRRIGFLIVHHTNKPPTGREKPDFQAGELAYLGAGSAEWANACRAVISIRSIGSPTVYELNLGKRGARARWRDANDRPLFSRYIAYAREEGTIFWRDAEPAELAPFLSPDKATTAQDLVDLIAAGAATKAKAVAALVREHGVKRAKAYNLVNEAIAAGYVRVGGPRNKQTLTLTGKLASRAPTEDQDEDTDDE